MKKTISLLIMLLIITITAYAQNESLLCNNDNVCNNNETSAACFADCGDGACIINAKDFYCDRYCPGDPDCDFVTGTDTIILVEERGLQFEPSYSELPPSPGAYTLYGFAGVIAIFIFIFIIIILMAKRKRKK